MKKDLSIVLENKNIAKDTYKMTLHSDLSGLMKAGQFINVRVEGQLLARPISICLIKDNSFVIIYKIVGEGTSKLSFMKKDDKLEIFGPLGNGFNTDVPDNDILIIGGGIGVPPLYQLAREMAFKKKSLNVVLGFNTGDAVFLEEEFKQISATFISTVDGSYGYKGNVIDLIKQKSLKGLIYACGPSKMLNAIESNFKDGYVSKEARMACGIGACMACVCKDKKDENISYRVCADGPVFKIGQVL